MSVQELLFGAPPYVALMASLPALPSIVAAKRLPISRLRLEQRLRVLQPADKVLLGELQALFALPHGAPPHGAPPATDAMLVERARQVVPRLPSAALRRAVADTMASSTITAALRRRRRNEPPPTTASWGYGPWTRTIAEHWQEPGLGVERAFPWVREAAEHVDHGDAIALESLLMREFWAMTGRLRVGHDFDFTAVALYVMRYQFLERRVAYDPETATLRFRRLVEHGLASFAQRRAVG